MGRHRLLKELAVSLLAKGTNPVGVALHIADVVDGRLGEAYARILGIVHFITEIAGRTVDVDIGLGLGAHVGN